MEPPALCGRIEQQLRQQRNRLPLLGSGYRHASGANSLISLFSFLLIQLRVEKDAAENTSLKKGPSRHRPGSKLLALPTKVPSQHRLVITASPCPFT